MSLLLIVIIVIVAQPQEPKPQPIIDGIEMLRQHAYIKVK